MSRHGDEKPVRTSAVQGAGNLGGQPPVARSAYSIGGGALGSVSSGEGVTRDRQKIQADLADDSVA